MQLLYGKQGNVQVVARPRVFATRSYGRFSSSSNWTAVDQQISHSKSSWLLPSLGRHVLTKHILYIWVQQTVGCANWSLPYLGRHRVKNAFEHIFVDRMMSILVQLKLKIV